MIPAEWPAQAADTIVETVQKVRDRTTKPAIIAVRGLVYGLLATIIAVVAFVLLLILIVRLWANYVPGHVWVIYAIFFVAFAGAGWFLFRKANAIEPAPDH
jgi:hypothetical protein